MFLHLTFVLQSTFLSHVHVSSFPLLSVLVSLSPPSRDVFALAFLEVCKNKMPGNLLVSDKFGDIAHSNMEILNL